MADIKTWDPVAGNNNDPAPDGWPASSIMLANEVDETGREMMAATRRYAADGSWFDFGHTYAAASATSFTVSPGTDYSAIYLVGRRVRVVDSGTVYGAITSYTHPSGVVTIAADSGSLSGTITGVSLGPEANALNTGFPAGVILAYGGTSPPAGWLLCDGSTLDSTANPEYAALFAAIGTSFGGTGAASFNLPDARGRALFGLDNMNNSVGTGGGDAARLTSGGSGVDGDTLGASGGDELMQQHNHDIEVDNLSGLSAAGGGGWANQSFGFPSTKNTENDGAGSGQNVPPALVVGLIIKL